MRWALPKLSRPRTLAALTLLALAGVGTGASYVVTPRHGVCVHRDMSFWRTEIRATEMRDNLYMLSTYGTDLISGNTAALVGPEGVLLVDPGHPEMLGKLRAALPRQGGRRIRFVLNTHAHPDHSCANGALFAQGAVVVGHENVRRYFETSSWAPRRSLGDTPQVTYDDELVLRFNGEQVRLIHPPEAHTDGDSIVVFERANVIHTGDIFVNRSYPYLGGSSIDGYIAAQEFILNFADEETLIVPGHGPLARREDLEQSLELMRTVRARIAAYVAEGLTLEQVLERHPLDDLDSRWGQGTFIKGQNMAEWVYASLRNAAAAVQMSPASAAVRR